MIRVRVIRAPQTVCVCDCDLCLNMFDCFGEVHRHHVGQFYLLSQGKAGMPCREILAVRRMLLDQHRTSTANCRPLVPVVARLSECTVISRKQSMKTAAGPSNNPQLWMCKRRRKLSPSLSRTFFRDHLRETLRGWRTPSSRCFFAKKEGPTRFGGFLLQKKHGAVHAPRYTEPG